MEDALILYPIFQKMLNLTNSILTNSLKMPKMFEFRDWNMKYSNGYLVASSFDKFIRFYSCGKPKYRYQYDQKRLKMQAAFAKLSLLPIYSKKYGENRVYRLYVGFKILKTIDRSSGNPFLIGIGILF
jgi:hypothetical protein